MYGMISVCKDCQGATAGEGWTAQQQSSCIGHGSSLNFLRPTKVHGKNALHPRQQHAACRHRETRRGLYTPGTTIVHVGFAWKERYSFHTHAFTCRQLVADTLARARRHEHEDVSTGHGGFDDLLVALWARDACRTVGRQPKTPDMKRRRDGVHSRANMRLFLCWMGGFGMHRLL